MERTNNFIKTTMIGGMLVLLPGTIVLLLFGWLFGKAMDIVRPVTRMLKYEGVLEEVLAILVSVGGMIAICFLIGLFVKTNFGKWSYNLVEAKVLKKVPTYSLVRETILQFSGAKKFPFSTVAMVKLYGSDVLTTGFVMNSHASGYQSCFIPTGPNPTSGMIYHVPQENVYIIEADVQETMRMIFNCGSGSSHLIDAFLQVVPEDKRDILPSEPPPDGKGDNPGSLPHPGQMIPGRNRLEGKEIV